MIQLLEPRTLFSISVENGVLLVRGTRQSETMSLAWRQTATSEWLVTIFDGSRTQQWGWSGNNSWNSISVYGGNGADAIDASANLAGFSNTRIPPVPIVLNAGAANDTVLGSDRGDAIYGGSGYDYLTGANGDDVLHGEGGKDTLVCGAGNDSAFGDSGRDKVLGDAGNDVIRGGAADDQIDGGIGDDLLLGEGGIDALFAGSADAGPFFRGANSDLDHDTLWGSGADEPMQWGDQIFL